MDLSEIYERCGVTLFRRAFSWLRDRATAEDAVHAVFARLVERGCLGIDDVESYLHAALGHELSRIVKQRVTAPIESIELVSAHDSVCRDGLDRINHALAALPPEQREVVVLHVFAELTFDRIATLLAISPNTVASRYRYAREKLSEILDDDS